MNNNLNLIYLLLILTQNFSCDEKKAGKKEFDKSELISNTSLDTIKFTSGINSIFQDSKGNFWFGSREEGVSNFDGQSFNYYTTNEGLADNKIRSIREDDKGNIKNYSITLGQSNNFAHTIYKDKNNELWFVLTNGNVFKFNEETFDKQF